MSTSADDPVGQARIAAFRQGLQKFCWTEGENVRIDIRWAGGNADLDRKFATELVALTPDVILATASPTVAALQGASRTVPIVFAHAVAASCRVEDLRSAEQRHIDRLGTWKARGGFNIHPAVWAGNGPAQKAGRRFRRNTMLKWRKAMMARSTPLSIRRFASRGPCSRQSGPKVRPPALT